jgi:ferredoxin-thioredoxin reductase catalytic subunit
MITLEQVRRRAESDAKTYGYYLVPDVELLQAFLEGLKANEDRYGYPSCPCRLASGNLEYDRDIICPCDYRDPDVIEYGACYCRLYVNKAVYESKDLPSVPERRPMEKQMRAFPTDQKKPATGGAAPPTLPPDTTGQVEEEKEDLVQITVGKKKLWYCRQCGYVVFREDPPYICPICKAKKEMFAEIKTSLNLSG